MCKQIKCYYYYYVSDLGWSIVHCTFLCICVKYLNEMKALMFILFFEISFFLSVTFLIFNYLICLVSIYNLDLIFSNRKFFTDFGILYQGFDPGIYFIEPKTG